jgi:isopenicillin N synthase-like dioxygenase
MTSLIHYPAVSFQLLQSGELVRNPAHSDLSTLTLLFQQDVGGLEIADMSSTEKTSSAAVAKSGKFICTDPEPGTVLVLAGYLLMRWTNGRWKNAVHRVMEPRSPTHNKAVREIDHSEGMAPERYSIAFFGFPDAAACIEPLSTCYSDEKPKKWGAINAGD